MRFYRSLLSWLRPAATVLIFSLSSYAAGAQSWSVSNKTVTISMGAILYIESAHQRPGAPKGVKDTLTGTAFLIADSDKVYLVTAKHLIVAALTGKNQQLANNSIFISASWKNDDKGMKLLGLSGWGIHKRPYVFSTDKEDIAIISFQKNKYKNILATILKQERKPIPVDSIDTSASHSPGESFFLPTYYSFKEKGKRIKQEGISPGEIKIFNETSPLFSINHFVDQSSSGSPVILNDKIIGVLTHEDGVFTNADIVRAPFRTAKSARTTKASVIVSLLKKLQQNENARGFN